MKIKLQILSEIDKKNILLFVEIANEKYFQ